MPGQFIDDPWIAKAQKHDDQDRKGPLPSLRNFGKQPVERGERHEVEGLEEEG